MLQVNQTGGRCGPDSGWSPSLGQDDPVYRASHRFLDPAHAAAFTNATSGPGGAKAAAAAAAAFDRAWAAAQRARAAGDWNASAAWRELAAALPAALAPVAPVSAGRCGGGGPVVGWTGGSCCVSVV